MQQKMFFYYQRMVALGFEPVLQFQPRGNDRVGSYQKLYPEHHALLVFSEYDPHPHRLVLYRLTPAQWRDYFEGRVALALDLTQDKPGTRAKNGGTFIAGNPVVIREGGGKEEYFRRSHQLQHLVEEVEREYALVPTQALDHV
jgi:hypothetical protein